MTQVKTVGLSLCRMFREEFTTVDVEFSKGVSSVQKNDRQREELVTTVRQEFAWNIGH